MYSHELCLEPKVKNEKQFVQCETGFEHASPPDGEATTPSRWQAWLARLQPVGEIGTFERRLSNRIATLKLTNAAKVRIIFCEDDDRNTPNRKEDNQRAIMGRAPI